ncbi:glycosyltransferase family A protein [Variovorax dokdonensis]|uniref:Glycosyltransferase family A protein n=1 Tax=Variovorax dokdonensis TaxID=344883 RepID=A0ABT7NB37_9BURK|nr:glycosyltransferase family A protein [Variovorax dokdonensis]MDM0045161.1 glycosyltransferase family A protein [Variovorax dokdonensis]
MHALHKKYKSPPPTVVVIIPFYNGARFIERAIASVFSQSVPSDEVIVVNDGSAPEEREALGELAKRYPFRIVDKQNGGQGSARNAGVAASSSNYICFLDQDDFYLDNHIEALVEGIPVDEPRFGFVYADLYEADGTGNVITTSMIRDLAEHPKKKIVDLLRRDMYVLPSASLTSRVAFEAVGGFDEQFMGFEDDDLFLRIFRAGYTNYFIDKAVTVWCIHTESTSYSMRMLRSRFRYFKKLVAMFPDEPHRGRFYLRDYLLPRFGRVFVEEVFQSIKFDRDNKAELGEMLAEFTRIVDANPYVPRRYKRKLSFAEWLLRSSPRSAVRFASAVVHLPGIRHLRQLLRRTGGRAA